MRTLIIGMVAGVLYLQQQAQLPATPWWMLAAWLGLSALGALLRQRWRNTSGRWQRATQWLQTIQWPKTRRRLKTSQWLETGRWLAGPVQLAAGMNRLAALGGTVWHLLLGFGFGFYWAAGWAAMVLADSLPAALEGRNLQLQGIVADLPYRFEGGTRFQFAVEAAHLDGQPVAVPPNLMLGWYQGGNVAAGERWRLTVRLQRPHGNANPQGFDYELWLLEQRIRATGYVREDGVAGENQRLEPFVWRFGTVIAAAREWLRQRIYAALPDAHYAGVLVALVLGDQRAISQSDWTLFNQTGVGHLMSISGLHITMVAGLFAALANFLWRRSFFTRAQWPLLLPAQKVAALAAALMALLYVALTGFGVPAQRTLIMLTVVALALWFDRISSVSHVLCAALAVVLLFDPWAVMWPGFWLSFGAVALILYASVGRVAARLGQGRTGGALWRELRAAAHTQYIVTLGLLPLSLLLFSQYSLVSPLANALAIPVVSFIVTPLALLGSIAPAPFGGWLLTWAHGVLEWLIRILGKFSAFAVWSAPQPEWWMFLLALAGVLWLLAPRGWPARWLGALLSLPLLLNRPATPSAGQFWVTAFDVGQGTAVLVETAGHRLLYDSGPQYSLTSDGGNRVILPYLKTRGVKELNEMIISHRDNDHAGGALSILQSMPVASVRTSLEANNPVVLAAKGASAQQTPANRHQPCFAGQAWEWDGVRFDMLHPAADSYARTDLKSNARSCTLKISSPAGSILLPGDIEAAQEQQLLQTQAAHLPVTVLLVPHHGSGTSSTLAFLQTLQPQIALFQVGHRNRYHHPKPEVFARYRELGIQRWRTDEQGALELQFGPQLTISAYRQTHQRYWYGR